MRVRLLFVSIVALVGVAQSATAHGNEAHGKPVMGNVVALEKDSFVIKGEKGDIKVAVSGKTEYTTGDGSEVTTMRPETGDHVLVYGTILGDGSIVAKEVTVHRMAKKSGDHTGHAKPEAHGEGGHAAHDR